MSYLHIQNLYKSREILEFRKCYAMEKIHGTSAHIAWKDSQVEFFSGGCKYEEFVKLFNLENLVAKFTELGHPQVIVFGEAYGGKMQSMKASYGIHLKFVVFEVKIGDSWLAVPQAESVAIQLGLDFVPWREISTELSSIDAEKDSDSVQAVKCGCGEGKKREGIVLRPLFECHLNNGERVIAKHKREDFVETKTPRPLDKDKFEVLTRAEEIATEWVTEMRLTHVLDGFPGAGIEQTGDIIKAMLEDVLREGVGEIEESKDMRIAVSRHTVLMFKRRISNELQKSEEV